MDDKKIKELLTKNEDMKSKDFIRQKIITKIITRI